MSDGRRRVRVLAFRVLEGIYVALAVGFVLAYVVLACLAIFSTWTELRDASRAFLRGYTWAFALGCAACVLGWMATRRALADAQARAARSDAHSDGEPR